MQNSLRNFKILFFLLLLFLVFSGTYFFLKKEKIENSGHELVPKIIETIEKEKTENESEVSAGEQKKAAVEKEILAVDVLQVVPFVVQAPGGKWGNHLFQNGCEEASLAMAMAWVQNRTFTLQGAEKEILNISAWEEKVFGFAVDASIDDTARIIREYYDYEKFEILRNVSADELKKQLAIGRLVLVQMNGKMLANPHYTPPGPDEHMLVVTGYDSKNDQFITNDPGTKFGQNYYYDVEKFMQAIWSYPTGPSHTVYPGPQKAKKDAMVVWK